MFRAFSFGFPPFKYFEKLFLFELRFSEIYNFFGNLSGNFFVMIVAHGKVPSPRSHGAENDSVTEHFRKRRLSLYNLEPPSGIDPHNPSPTAVEISHNITEVIIGHHNFHVHDRLEKNGRSVFHGFFKRHGRSNFKSHFRGVYIVVASKNKACLDINHGITSEIALRESLFQPFFHCGDV